MNRQRTVTYAQNREDLLLSGFFDEDEKGFYVDVGAEAPTDLSVTKIFYDKGWRGINVEPIKKQYELFVKERPRDINLNIGIAEKSGTLMFREYEGTGYSTLSSRMKKDHIDDDERYVKKFEDYTIPVKSLKDIFQEHNVSSIQFLKVDVEGFEYEVLEGNDWKKYRPEVICIEANHVRKDWRKLLKDNNYSYVFFDGLNEYYTDNNTDRAKHFDYVRSIIYKEPILHYSLLPEIDADAVHIRELEEKTEKQASELEAATAQIQTLSALLNEVTPLRRHVLKSVKGKLASADRKITARLQNDNNFTPLDVELPPGSIESAHEADRKNLDLFTTKRKSSPLLPAYSRIKRQGHRAARKVITKLGGTI